MAKPELQRPYRKKYFDPLYKSVYGEEFPGLQSDLLSNKTKFLTTGKEDYPGLKIWKHANAAAVLRDRIGAVDKIIKGKFGGTLPAWLKESGGKNPGGKNPFDKAGPNKKYGNPFQSSSGKTGNNPGSKDYETDGWSPPKIPDKYLTDGWVPPEESPGGYCERFKPKRKPRIRDYIIAWLTRQGYESLYYYDELVGPMTAEEAAMAHREKHRLGNLIGLGQVGGSKVKEVWEMYLGEPDKKGGTADEQDLSAKFAKEFTDSETTKRVTDFLVDELKKTLRADKALWPEVGVTKYFDLASLIGVEPFIAINKHRCKYGMEFLGRDDAPSLIAGGIGKEIGEYGAYPSTKQDYRGARGWGSMYRSDSADLSVRLYISYIVEDTVDLCPGFWGEGLAPGLTIPFSRYEATGISGDVPFHVVFPAPPIRPFTIFVLDYTNVYPWEKEKKSPAPTAPKRGFPVPESFGWIRALYDGNSPNPGPYKKGAVKAPANPGNPGVNPLGALPSGKSLGWSEEEVARRAVALAAAPAATAGRPEVGGSPASAGTTRNVTFYQTVDNVTINTGGPLDAQALRGALERYMRSEAQAVA